MPQLVAKIANCMGQGLSHKLTIPQLLKKFPHFMEPLSLKPRSQAPDTCTRPEPEQSN